MTAEQLGSSFAVTLVSAAGWYATVFLDRIFVTDLSDDDILPDAIDYLIPKPLQRYWSLTECWPEAHGTVWVLEPCSHYITTW